MSILSRLVCVIITVFILKITVIDPMRHQNKKTKKYSYGIQHEVSNIKIDAQDAITLSKF